jgi:predicted NACHT family NTPase
MALESLLPLAGAWLWSSYGKSLADKIFHAGKEKWDESKWETAAKAYRAKIIKLYDSMQIMGMAEPVPLDDIFTEAYMLDKPTAFGRFDIERLKQMSADPEATPPDAKRINGLKLVVDKGNLFILGKPGAGKTTFLKYIAVKAAEQTIDKVPIFVSLKQWSDSKLELLPFIAKRFDICNFPVAQPFVEELLKAGGAIVLFDGLDEVNQESGQRDQQVRWMKEFIEQYDRTQCLITCRVAASDYTFEPFTYVEIADFTEAQIKTFVGNWFRDDEETRDKFMTEFARGDNKGLRDLARTPLLLTLLCLAFNETLTFPQRRVEIYQEALDALLKKWDSSRRIKRDEVYRKLSLGHKENMLARIAAETFEKNQYFIPQAELERHITDFIKNVPPHDADDATDGEVILKTIAVQHGIFVERAREIYSFSHLTFQEYFTAKYIVDNAAKGTLTKLVKAHGTDLRWREVFLLTTSLLPDASQFMMIFRRGVDELLEGDEKLSALLAWADKKSASIKTDSWVARPSYLFVGVFYVGKSRALFLAFNLAHNHTLILARAHLQNLGLILDYDPKRAHPLDLDIALTRAYSNALSRDLGLTQARNLARDVARDLARALGLNKLAKELDTLPLPDGGATISERQEFADKLRALMIKYRNIGHEWNLTERQATQLANYINATGLLRDCLELAFMSPDEKKAMLESLYLPPAQLEEDENA